MNDNNDDMLDDVIHRYSDSHTEFEEDLIEEYTNNSKSELVKAILQLLEEGNFSQREKLIFKEVVYYGFTHEAMGLKLGISRTRVTQILKKTKAKLYKLMESNEQIWKLIGDADITIEDGKW